MTYGELVAWGHNAPSQEKRETLAIFAFHVIDSETYGYQIIEAVALEIAIIRWRHAMNGVTTAACLDHAHDLRRNIPHE